MTGKKLDSIPDNAKSAYSGRRHLGWLSAQRQVFLSGRVARQNNPRRLPYGAAGAQSIMDRRGRRTVMPEAEIFQRDDGWYEVGLHQPIGPFETRQFAVAVATHQLARTAWLRKNSKHRTEGGA
ncbi:hypothetical protein [Bradyrhizobium sp. CCBAU 53415]|uniref:hypothetical protein n=1 Tax=Bradyrhizobium sp. CCBAU 53415 TaxID=1325119 RepID=UPI00230611FB|nr:hypothetical protein [Bradyrhizobium sp. CCBAU 53415]